MKIYFDIDHQYKKHNITWTLISLDITNTGYNLEIDIIILGISFHVEVSK